MPGVAPARLRCRRRGPHIRARLHASPIAGDATRAAGAKAMLLPSEAQGLDEKLPSLFTRQTPAHPLEYGPENGECPDDRRKRGRACRPSVSGLRRDLMPPCGSPLMRTTNSVSLPVSELNASSEMIREDRGDAIPAIRSNASCGIRI